ncbi:MAG TPA: hypothetical protein VGF86_06835 [Candidatus Tumulicola sp.]|jgi:hypothetical protein
MILDETEHSKFWLRYIGPRVRSLLALEYLSLTEKAALNPQPIPPGRDHAVIAGALEALALYRASAEAEGTQQAALREQAARGLRRAADQVNEQ